jgi:integrase
LLVIRVSDVFTIDGNPADFFDVREEKTGKANRITITPKVKETLKLYAETYPEVVKNPNHYIFFAKKKFPNGIEAIKRGMSWIILSKLCETVGLKGNFGNHTLRKTWGYQARIQGIPLEIIQHKLNHSSLAVTQKYL